MVMVPLKRCSQISLQSWPRGRGRSSRWRSTLSHLVMSSLRNCSAADPKKPPRHPRPRRCVTGRPTVPLDEKKKRLMCGLTWLTTLKLTLKWRFKLFSGMSVFKEPSFHLCPKLYGSNLPSRFFRINTTGLRIPGTAVEARTADQITQSGAVR